MNEKIIIGLIGILLIVTLFITFTGNQEIPNKTKELIGINNTSKQIIKEKKNNTINKPKTNNAETNIQNSNNKTNNTINTQNNTNTNNNSFNTPNGNLENPLSQECNYDSICDENENQVYCPEDCGELPDLDDNPPTYDCPAKGKQYCE